MFVYHEEKLIKKIYTLYIKGGFKLDEQQSNNPNSHQARHEVTSQGDTIQLEH